MITVGTNYTYKDTDIYTWAKKYSCHKQHPICVLEVVDFYERTVGKSLIPHTNTSYILPATAISISPYSAKWGTLSCYKWIASLDYSVTVYSKHIANIQCIGGVSMANNYCMVKMCVPLPPVCGLRHTKLTIYHPISNQAIHSSAWLVFFDEKWKAKGL